ncbi:MAG TPA: hypothetical protein VN698_09940 [Bacteroidia bacterium]|nr:hypothetical protein [Bacteroidia bacterium]
MIKIIKILIVALIIYKPCFVFSQNTGPILKEYNGSPEKIEISLSDVQKFNSIKDIKPSYSEKYEILGFEIYFTCEFDHRRVTTCLGSSFSVEAYSCFRGCAKVGSKIFIDNIGAKDFKTGKIITLQSLKILVK